MVDADNGSTSRTSKTSPDAKGQKPNAGVYSIQHAKTSWPIFPCGCLPSFPYNANRNRGGDGEAYNALPSGKLPAIMVAYCYIMDVGSLRSNVLQQQKG
jgi:hypothetical protein